MATSKRELSKSGSNDREQNESKDDFKEVKRNPNERANENLPQEERAASDGSEQGAGSEITDGEDG